MTDGDKSLILNLPANNDTNQIHGGAHHLATVNWQLELATLSDDKTSCTVIFKTSQSDMLDGWP